GGSGYYTCVGLLESAAEQAGLNGGQGFIPNSLESVPDGHGGQFPLLSPELLYWAASNPDLFFTVGADANVISRLKNWLQGFFDPADFILTDPLGRRLGHTQDLGDLNEIPGAFYSGTGAVQQFLIPDPLPGAYTLQVFGLGEDAFAVVG